MDGYILGVYAGAVRVGTLGYDQPQDAFQFAFALADFCVRLGIEHRYFARELTRLCGFALQEAPAQAADPAYMGEEVAFVQGLAQFVATRAQALLAMARDIPKFTADNF